MSAAAPRAESGPARAAGESDRLEVHRNQFGTFGGVFTPTVLTILGVIMFMRAGFVVGQAGILGAGAILALATSITLLTSLSVSALATNTQVEGGGAYFLISRSLGPEFGGAIGLTLFPAQALSVPFYILGFAEAVVATFPSLAPHFLALTLGTAAALGLLSYVGAGWAIRVQYFILAVLILSIVAFLGGAAWLFDSATFVENLHAAPAELAGRLGFWTLFAIYFPAVTGIMAGVNMSGDLANPSRSLPRGTLLGVLVGFLVYGAQILLSGGALSRADLIERPYDSLVYLASLAHLGPAVAAGVFAATLSSAIGSFVGAPRVLQALSRDDIIRPLRPFAAGSARGDEPRRALLLTAAITVAVLLMAGGGGGGAALNTLASIVTMFFLATYGVTNLAAFVEAFSGNPSFRPRFRAFHWATALAGTIGCGATALLIDPLAAVAAGVVVAGIYYSIRRREFQASFGDARWGYLYARVRDNLLRLEERRDAKNWRPTALVLSGNPHSRLSLVRFAVWLEAGRGVVTLAHLLVGDIHELAQARRAARAELQAFVQINRLPAFVETAVVSDFGEGLKILLQTHSLGPLKPNMVLFGWCADRERVDAYVANLHCAVEIDMSLVLLIDRGTPPMRGLDRRRFVRSAAGDSPRVDVWWRGLRNGSLMLILAHLLQGNRAWARTRIRVLRECRADDEEDAHLELSALVEAARIEAEVRVVVSERPFREVLVEESGDATLVFLGFRLRPQGEAAEFQAHLQALTAGLPTTLLVHSSGEADLLA